MSDYNHVGISGRLTRDMELRYIPSGQAVGEFGLASNRKFKDKEETVFVDITVWGKTAEALAPYLTKGKHVIVGARLKLDTWENNEGGKRSKLVLVADTVDLSPKGGDSTPTPTSSPAASSPDVEIDVDEDVPF